MSPKSFRQWLNDIKSKGLAVSDADCARLLGVSTMGLVHMKRNGSNKRTALACAALLAGLPPYGDSE